jgi:hypothetical protein
MSEQCRDRLYADIWEIIEGIQREERHRQWVRDLHSEPVLTPEEREHAEFKKFYEKSPSIYVAERKLTDPKFRDWMRRSGLLVVDQGEFLGVRDDFAQYR